MTIEPQDLGTTVKSERATGKYRSARRDGSATGQLPPADEPRTRDDTDPRDALDSPVVPVARDDRIGGLGLLGPAARPPSLPSLDPDGLTEPVYRPVDWPEPAGGSLVDHPLLRGLLMELPEKGTTPAPEWLDRWFEATRAILELLYVQSAGRSR